MAALPSRSTGSMDSTRLVTVSSLCPYFCCGLLFPAVLYASPEINPPLSGIFSYAKPFGMTQGRSKLSALGVLAAARATKRQHHSGRGLGQPHGYHSLPPTDVLSVGQPALWGSSVPGTDSALRSTFRRGCPIRRPRAFASPCFGDYHPKRNTG